MGKKVVICGGGTGGHISPGLAVAAQLRRLDVPVAWLGTKGGMEEQLVPAQGIDLEVVQYAQPSGGWFGYAASMLWLMPTGWEAMRILQRHDARLVLGLGGYPSLPGVSGALLARLPCVVHEQNVIPGLANRMVAPLVSRVLTSNEATFKWLETKVVGNPVREQFDEVASPAERFAGRKGALRLLVVGGSKGAARLNSVVPAALAQAAASWKVIHVAGAGHQEQTRQAYADAQVKADVREYLDEVAEKMASADLVICRAGASTIAEIASVGVAAVLVPYPHARSHQVANARTLQDAGAAKVVKDAELADTARLAGVLDELASRAQLEQMAASASLQARPQAAQEIAALCLQELENAA